MVKEVRECFMGLYSLVDGEEGTPEIVAKAKKNPEKYVMKPQREGGGNNFYNHQIVDSLDKFSARQRSAFILMDRISPPPVSTFILREGNRSAISGVCELGIFSVFLRFEFPLLCTSDDRQQKW